MTVRRKALIILSALIALMLGLPLSSALSTASAQSIQVFDAVPKSAEQGTLGLAVSIKGNGFKAGAAAKFVRTKTKDPGGITVKTTQFVSITELIATIDIADAAALSLFDIQVQNADGRTGKGTELFTVVAKGHVSLDVPLSVEFASFVGPSQVQAGWYGDGAAYTSDASEHYLIAKLDYHEAYQDMPPEGDLHFAVSSASGRWIGFDFSLPVIDPSAEWCPEVCPVQPSESLPNFSIEPITQVWLFDMAQWSPPNYDFLTPNLCGTGWADGVCPNDFLVQIESGRKEYRLRFAPNLWRKLALPNTIPYGVMAVAYDAATDGWTLSPLASRVIEGVPRQEPCPVVFERKDVSKGRNTWVFLGCYDMPYEIKVIRR